MFESLRKHPHLPLLVLLSALLAQGCTPAPGGEHYDLVLRGGRVVDPETDTDTVLNIGILDGMIAACTKDEIEGDVVVDVSGLVVAPGFIDLHAHGQDPVSNRLQALDGVTTALDLEAGAYPIGSWLESRAGEALINYGASVGHVGARMLHFDDVAVGHGATADPSSRPAAEESGFAYTEADDEDLEAILGLMERGLDEGGLGFGLGITYTPGASRHEILEIFRTAAARSALVSVHIRGQGSGGTLGAFQEVLANAAATGAPLHIVHINSSSNELAKVTLGMVRGARESGVDVTTEAYPYTAGSTLIQSALFDTWEDLPEQAYATLQWAATGERLTAETFSKYRKEGGWVIIHGRSEEMNQWLTAQPDVIVASDGIPFFYGPAHPRGAGTYSRVLGQYVRDKGALSLMDAVRKMTLLPAQRLEAMSSQMRKRGRVRTGAVADVTVFDPETVLDQATYTEGDRPSEGIEHVLVSGVFVVRDGELVEGVNPGVAIRFDAAGG